MEQKKTLQNHSYRSIDGRGHAGIRLWDVNGLQELRYSGLNRIHHFRNPDGPGKLQRPCGKGSSRGGQYPGGQESKERWIPPFPWQPVWRQESFRRLLRALFSRATLPEGSNSRVSGPGLS